jgi:hypothetical protein
VGLSIDAEGVEMLHAQGSLRSRSAGHSERRDGRGRPPPPPPPDPGPEPDSGDRWDDEEGPGPH